MSEGSRAQTNKKYYKKTRQERLAEARKYYKEHKHDINERKKLRRKLVSMSKELDKTERRTITAPNGEVLETLTIKEFANRLGKSPVTIRSWEFEGVTPPSIFRTKGTIKKRLFTFEELRIYGDSLSELEPLSKAGHFSKFSKIVWRDVNKFRFRLGLSEIKRRTPDG